MDSKLPPAQWKRSMQSDDRAVIWLFVIASSVVCLAEMFSGG